MQLPNEKELNQYDRWGVERPAHIEHGAFDPENLVPTTTKKWWVEGNYLMAETNHGLLAQRIPVDYICTGTDENNLPILKKVAIT